MAGAAAEPQRPEATESQADASEIAARAIASAAASIRNQQNDDLATDAYDAVVRDLLLRIETIQKETGNVSRELEGPLFELGKLYLSANQCQKAIPLLKQTTLLIRQLDGVMSPRQLPAYELLTSCFISGDMQLDLVGAQEQVLLIRANEYGKEDVRMVPALVRAGECYEQAGMYEDAQEIYARAIRIAQKSGGEQGARMIAPLRAMARTHRLKIQFESSSAQSLAQGERLLQRAARIAREAPDVSWQEKVETLLDLADWLQISGAIRDSPKIYQEAWNAAVAGSGPDNAARLLGEPAPILYRAAVGVPLRQAPQQTENLKHYWIEYEFTVSRLGEVRDLLVREASAPRDIQWRIAENLKRTRFRPGFVNGVAQDVRGVRIRQGVWVQP